MKFEILQEREKTKYDDENLQRRHNKLRHVFLINFKD